MGFNTKMTEQEVYDFLDTRPGWLVLATIGADGFPHSVPISYFRLGGDIYCRCRAGSQKTVNIGRNPKVSALVEAGSKRPDIKGVMIRGTAEVITEPGEVLRLARESARIRGVPGDERPTVPREGAAYVRIGMERVISWDFSKDT